MLGSTAWGNLHLESLQPVGLRTVVRADDGTRTVFDPEHQPSTFQAAQIGLVRQRGEVLTDPVGVVVASGSLEFNDLALPLRQQRAEQTSQSRFIHGGE